jgi:hypothetical protein
MSKREPDDLRAEYPSELIRSGVRGKYAARYREGTNIVLIDPELQKHYPDSEAVNQALREHLARHSGGAT